MRVTSRQCPKLSHPHVPVFHSPPPTLHADCEQPSHDVGCLGHFRQGSAAFQAEANGKASKSVNQANSAATVMRGIKVPAPSLPEQERLIAKVRKLEKQIADARAVIAVAPACKRAIPQRHL